MMAPPQSGTSRARPWPLGEQAVQVTAGLRFRDLSWRARLGCKGPGAEGWLSAAGLSVPSGANSAAISVEGVLVARLARSEFLIEAVDGGGERVVDLAQQLGTMPLPAGVYPVERQDVVMGIEGSGSIALLRQVCSVDFSPMLGSGPAQHAGIIMTSMIGVAVVGWPRREQGGSLLTLWLDPSFGHYFCSTLFEVGRATSIE